MSHELEEQQRLAYELREQLKSMEIEERTLGEKVKTLEAKLVVQDLLEQVKAKREVLTQLRSRIEELEGKLKPSEDASLEEQVNPQEEPVRRHF